MSREIVDSLGACAGLVVAAGVEREVADELAVLVDHADVLVGDEEFDWTAFVGSAEADVVELAHVADADLAVGVDLVLAHPEVGRAVEVSPGRLTGCGLS